MTAQRKTQAPAAANDNGPASDAQRVAKYQADMVEWHARQERARKARLAFAKSYRPLGEPHFPTPRKTYKKAYYEGGFRMVIDGCPIRVAAHVKDWPARAKAMLGRGSQTRQEEKDLEWQIERLFPNHVPRRFWDKACCVVHRTEYWAGEHYGGECEECRRAAWRA